MTGSGTGSGSIYKSTSTTSYIVTNNHVVEGFQMVVVGLSNGKIYPAKIVGTDPTSDIAVLKIDEKKIKEDGCILKYSNKYLPGIILFKKLGLSCHA